MVAKGIKGRFVVIGEECPIGFGPPQACAGIDADVT